MMHRNANLFSNRPYRVQGGNLSIVLTYHRKPALISHVYVLHIFQTVITRFDFDAPQTLKPLDYTPFF